MFNIVTYLACGICATVMESSLDVSNVVYMKTRPITMHIVTMKSFFKILTEF